MKVVKQRVALYAKVFIQIRYQGYASVISIRHHHH